MNAFKLGGAFSRLGRKLAIARLQANTPWATGQDAEALSQFAGLRVLCFHSISDLWDTKIARYGIPKHEFQSVIDTLLNRGFDFLDPRELFDSKVPSKGTGSRDLLITFDDGYEDVLDAFDILKKRGIRALIFPVSSMIGAANNWDKDQNIPNLPLLTGDQLKFLVDNGWMVGSHTHTHPDLRSLNDSGVIREILQSISALKCVDLECAMALAYPYGSHDGRIAKLAKRTGLRFAFTTQAGFITGQTSPMTIPRIEVYRGELGDILVKKIVRPHTQGKLLQYIGKFRSKKFRQ